MFDYRVTFCGLPLLSRMTVIRMGQRELVVISPSPWSAELNAALALLGEVRYSAQPNLYHHLFVQDFV